MKLRFFLLWGLLLGMISVLVWGKPDLVQAQLAPLIQPGKTATYTFQGAQIEELVTFAKSQDYGFPIAGTDVLRCIRNAVPNAEYELRTESVVNRMPYSPASTAAQTMDRTCLFGFFTKKPLQSGWKLLSVKIRKAWTICGNNGQSSSIFSKMPISLSDDASFEIRVFYAGTIYAPATYKGCWIKLTYLDVTPRASAIIEKIQIQGPAMSDWRFAFRAPVTRPRRR